MDTDDAAVDRLRRSCERSLTWHGERSADDLLATLPSGIERDVYGEGGVVAELEAEVAALLGRSAAAFFVSGTMAQQAALRVHADRRERRTVAFHPTCHLELHELGAHEHLHGLTGLLVGAPDALVTQADLEEVDEPLAAVLLELPQREIGGLLPAWQELVAQTEWARAHGVATHLDGARLWQCGVAYGRPLADIAALFDTVYVSFYKDLGGITGSCLVGDEDVITEARAWRHRHGGTLFGLWPYAASSLQGLRERLPKMGAYLEHARAIADALRDVDGVALVPDPPHTSLFHLRLRATEETLRRNAHRIAREQRIWTWRVSSPTEDPAWRSVELSVGDATLELSPDEVRALVEELLRPT